MALYPVLLVDASMAETRYLVEISLVFLTLGIQ